MLTTFLLRFRDLIAPTIPEHLNTISTHGFVWWGWWRKPNEPHRLEELSAVRELLSQNPLEIGMFDRSTASFFLATTNACEYSNSGEFIQSPELSTTPEYYHTAKLPAWFRLTGIHQIEEREFVKRFHRVPLEEFTFYPLNGNYRESAEGARAQRLPLPGGSVIHISDLHFGADFGFPATANPGSVPLFQILEKDINKLCGDDVGLLVVSGDITTRGDASYLFNNGIPFLQQLSDEIGLKTDYVVIIPGNHDISLKDFTLTYDHENAFNSFRSMFYGSSRQQMEMLRYSLPSGRPLDVFTINSVKLRNKENSNYGWIDWEGCEKFLSAQPQEPGALRIAIIHHHLVSGPREEPAPNPAYPFASVSVTLNSGAVIDGLQQFGFQMVLHGHQHTPALQKISRARFKDGTIQLTGLDEVLYLIAGGSAGVVASRIEGSIRDNTYGILKVADDCVSLRVRAFNPSGIVRDLYTAELPIR